MSTSIVFRILVEAKKMCEYHLKENCFHPEKVKKGLVAKPCEVHDCEHCTNKNWQKQKIEANFNYYQEILDMINSPIQPSSHNEASPAIQEKNSGPQARNTSFLLKNPLQGLFK